jgi:predicted nucleic acid-binding protein
MTAPKAFFDTNILLYLLSGDDAKADRAESVLLNGGWVSVQVLNEFAAVASRKLSMTWPEIKEALAPIRVVCEVVPITTEMHDLGLEIAERYGFSVYDSLIVASALLVGCEILFSEDLQDGQRINEQLVISNPFKP